MSLVSYKATDSVQVSSVAFLFIIVPFKKTQISRFFVGELERKILSVDRRKKEEGPTDRKLYSLGGTAREDIGYLEVSQIRETLPVLANREHTKSPLKFPGYRIKHCVECFTKLIKSAIS